METKAKIWLEKKNVPIMGEGRAALLRFIDETGSISSAARKLGMSYRYAWGEIREMETLLGEKLVEKSRGGRTHGKTNLTERGKEILEEFTLLEKSFGEVTKDKTFWEAIGLKLSARNALKGRIKSVEKDGVAAKVKIEIDAPATVTSLITSEAAEYLKLKKGDKVKAIVKATEVMIGK
jgi:molybdate transport system regulatory protein